MLQYVVDKKDGGKGLLIELEPGNLHRLQQGQPIRLRVEDMFPDGIPRKFDLLIGFADNPVARAKEMSERAEVYLNERGDPKKPHCPECRSTIEQLGIWKNESPVALAFCPTCGCTFGTLAAALFREPEPVEVPQPK